MEEFVDTKEVRFHVGFDFATILCSPLFLHPFRHRFRAAGKAGILSAAKRAEMADVEQSKKIIPLITCEVSFGQYVCDLVFGIDVLDLNLRIQMNSVNNQPRATLWVLDTCLIVGLLPLVINIIHCFIHLWSSGSRLPKLSTPRRPPFHSASQVPFQHPRSRVATLEPQHGAALV